MAEPNLTQLVAGAWENVVGDAPMDNIFTSNALFYALGEKGFKAEADGGREIEVSLEYALNSTFKSYDELEQLDVTRVNVFDAARYQWKIHAGTIVFSDLEKLRVAARSGKFDYIAEKLENGKTSHLADLNRTAYLDGTGNASKDIDGLTKIIPTTPTTGTVGGINRANFTFWRSKSTSGAKTTAAFDNLRSTFRSIYNQCSNAGVDFAPTAVLTSRTVYEGFEGTLVALERYNNDGANQRGAAVGFKNGSIKFKAADVMFDEDCSPSDSAYFLNPKFLKMFYLKGGWMKMKEAVEPSNQLSIVYRVFTAANMGTNNSRRLGVVYSIT